MPKKESMSYAIKTEGLSKFYGTTPVLDDVSFTVEPGTFFALVGKNGVGKSTLMRLLMRFEPASKGKGWVFGKDLDVDHPDFNAQVGYVSESIDYAVPTSLTNFFKFYRRNYPKWDNALFERVIREMGISMESQFRNLSRGQRMQVAFSAALASHPNLLILDEITSVMDANARSFFMHYLGNYTKQGGTVLMATNIIYEVQHFAQQVLLLHEGRAKLNCLVSDIAKNFVKVRRMPNTQDPIFADPDCSEVTLNSDGSSSHVLPIKSAEPYANAAKLTDKRAITIEEIFIYLTRNRWK